MLGAIKGLPAVLSGEMRDTVQLNAGLSFGCVFRMDLSF
jgi:hypothetical protein